MPARADGLKPDGGTSRTATPSSPLRRCAPAPQDLLKLARYRMVGAVPHSPAARMPTTVLAARHMRRTSSGGEGGGGGRATYRERDALASSLDDEGTPGPSGAACEGLLPAARPGSGDGGAAPPLRLGMRLPAVAVSQQAGQQPEQVLLYFGIIDFLQV